MRKPLDYIFPNPPSDADPHLLNQDTIPRHVAVFVVIKQVSKLSEKPFAVLTI